MKQHKILIIIIFCFTILLLIDILTGIWHWNRLNLLFDSATFNNLLTPILTILATIIYGLALRTTINQNKIILSQNIKPYYEKEIEKYIIKAKETKIDDKLLYNGEDINCLNYITYIMKTYLTLMQSEEFNIDYKKFEKKEILTKEYIKNRTYIKELFFLYNFSVGINSVAFLYNDLKSLIIEINNTKLIGEDKSILKKQLHRNLLLEYLSFFKQDSNHISSLPRIPFIYQNFSQENVTWDNLSNTSFNENYLFFKKELQ